jgi:predicted TIM-barrel fold metal-dependent hydrolase
MDRLDRSYPHHLQVDIHGQFLPSSRPDVMASEYFRRHMKAGSIFVGFDGDDHGLGYAVREAGHESFVFATDFPHESFDAESCRIELQHIQSREDLTQADKQAILGANAKRFYGIQ